MCPSLKPKMTKGCELSVSILLVCQHPGNKTVLLSHSNNCIFLLLCASSQLKHRPCISQKRECGVWHCCVTQLVGPSSHLLSVYQFISLGVTWTELKLQTEVHTDEVQGCWQLALTFLILTVFVLIVVNGKCAVQPVSPAPWQTQTYMPSTVVKDFFQQQPVALFGKLPPTIFLAAAKWPLDL